MPRRVNVQMLPSFFEPAELVGGTVVVVDVLRASTTIIQALANGAASVIPCADVAEAQCRAQAFDRSQYVLGGERGGVLIPGFDLDNSPRAYTPERIGGRTVIFTSTNGTRALRRAEQADRICIGAFANYSAVANWICTADDRPIHIVCAGTDRRLTAEDMLFAGLLADRLDPLKPPDLDLPTEMAMVFARRHGDSPEEILKTLRESRGGRNLRKLGMEADIEFAARVDSLPVVPVYDRRTGELRLAEAG